MNILILSCSLRPTSQSARMAEVCRDALIELGASVEFVDLRAFALPMCDGDKCYADKNAIALKQKVEAAEGILMAGPVYNYYLNAAAKNVVELTGRSWNEKVVGFLCAAGGRSSYMSVMSLANSLMLDFRCIILPRFVYAAREDFEGGTSLDVQLRLKELCENLLKVAGALDMTKVE